MASKYPSLFQPMKLGPLTLKNRIVKSGQWFLYAEPDGSCGDRIIAWYEGLAQYGPGLITIEESICEYPWGASQMPHVRLDDDRFIPGLTKLAEAVHKNGVPAVVQITHAGPAYSSKIAGGQPKAPSSIDPAAEPGLFEIAREMTHQEVVDLIELWAQAAYRCRKAGFDGVEIHQAHYALGNAFLSKRQNRRTDEFGCQNMDNRTRFGTSIVRRVRELCGSDFVIGVRLSNKEWGDPLGTTNEEACEIAKRFQAAGIDYIQSSGYGYNAFTFCAFPDLVIYPEPMPEAKEFAARIDNGGALIPETGKIKQAVEVPVSGVGRLSFAEADKAIKDGKMDLAVFGRQFMCDPEFPQKLREGREDEIRLCTRCLHCLHIMWTYQPVQCRCNPFAGNELTMQITPAKKKKKVMVVGAGPAGLEAARVASLRGHEVSIWDRDRELGGATRMAMFIKGEENDHLTEYISWFDRMLKKQGVKRHLGKEVTAKVVEKENPDVVILAPGAEAVEPALPVAKGAKVQTTEEQRKQAAAALSWFGTKMTSAATKIFLPGGKKIVVVGSDLPGIEAAEFLAKRGKQVTVVDDVPVPFDGVDIQWILKLAVPGGWLERKGIRVIPGVTFNEISKEGVSITTADGRTETIPCDSVLVVNKHKKNDALAGELKGKVKEAHVIGDAMSDKLGYVYGATHSAAELALRI
jgi:2,4-dienoyl-CoA reductase-like NADH-dependent reductase (Old Yellow Enzyme family)/thioredoxin reductase